MQNIDIARDEMVFCNNGHRIAKLREHIETAARYAQFSLNGLIRIGYTAQAVLLPSSDCILGSVQARDPVFRRNLRQKFSQQRSRDPHDLVRFVDGCSRRPGAPAGRAR